MSAESSVKRRVGELRPSQLLFTFGVGAIVELPHLSAMVMGLDDWPAEYASKISEERLLRAVQAELGGQVDRLLTPPVMPETAGFAGGPFDESASVGVPVAPFPRWLLCPYCRLLAPVGSNLFELKLDAYRRDRTRYVHRNCNKPGKAPTAVPARFLVACENGHLDDFPWVHFVHKGPTECRSLLRLIEYGASGEVADIEVRCDTCQASRRMADAFGREGRENLPPCRGRWPHLRTFAEEGCQGPAGPPDRRAILLGASNSWFPVMLSALSVPTQVDRLAQLITEHSALFDDVENQQNVKLLRSVGKLTAFAKYDDGQVWQALQKKRQGEEEPEHKATDLREPEWRVLSAPDPGRNSRDFQLREVQTPPSYRKHFEKVVLAERLREVRALIGFTRISSPGDFNEPAEMPAERRGPLSRAKPTWVPTSEVRGEGIFLQFSEPALQKWMKKAGKLEGDFFEAHKRWRATRGLPDPEAGFPGLRFVLLHSFAHALIRQLSLECGYTTASIRERVFSRGPGEGQGPMAGVLIYTAAPDSEGTLGGLVSLGEPKNLERHLDQALEGVRLCASDPLCSEHHPYRDGLTLHGAACHACLFAPETSCERGNRYLDRTVLVPTVDNDKLAFFG
jgi:hypothetical protein